MRGTIPAVTAVAAGGLVLLYSQMSRTGGLRQYGSPSPGRRLALSEHGMPVARRRVAPYVDVEESLVVRAPSGRAMAAVAALALGALLVSSMARSRRATGSTSSVEESIELNVPVSTAYNQWTQFEEFPRFMESVKEVKQLDDTHLHWRADVAGKPKEWDAEITEQIPDQRIAWRSTSGVKNAGVVSFHKLGDNRTKVLLQMDYDPEGLGEKVADVFGGVKLTAKGNLKRFKQLVETRGVETGAWRGTVAQQH